MAAVIEASGLRWSPAEGRAVLDGVDIHIAEGEIVALSGPSGAGKTVLGTLLLRLRDAASGTVRWLGEDVSHCAPHRLVDRRRAFQMLPQHTGALLPPWATVRASLVETLRSVRRLPEAAVADQFATPWVDRLGVRPLLDRLPAGLSGGEQRRASLLRVLFAEPRFAFIDEPDAGQDPQTAEEVLSLVADWAAERKVATLVVTHHPGLAARHATRRLLLEEGQLHAS